MPTLYDKSMTDITHYCATGQNKQLQNKKALTFGYSI
jgi:hypothetical protein